MRRPLRRHGGRAGRTRYLPPRAAAGREGRGAVLGRKGQRVRGDEGRRCRPYAGMPRDGRAALAGQRAATLPVRRRDGAPGRVDGRAARAEARRHGRHGWPARCRGVGALRGGPRARRGGGRPRRPAQRVPEARVRARMRRGGARADRAGVGGGGIWRRGGCRPARAGVLPAAPACRRRGVCRDCRERRRARGRVARARRRRGCGRRAGRPVAQARALRRL